MKIAFFVDSFPLISETFVLAQVTGMIDRGHDVTIFTNRIVDTGARHDAVAQYRLLEKTVRTTSASRHLFKRMAQALHAIRLAVLNGSIRAAFRTLNAWRFGREALGLSLLIRAATYFGRSNYDVIHCQFGHLGTGVMTLKQCGAVDGALVTSFRGTDAMKHASMNPDAFANLFLHGDRFLAVSHAVRQRLIDLGCPGEKINILRSGIDLSRFRFKGACDLHTPVRLISVGRLAPNKGICHALRAVRVLQSSGHDIRYRVVGDGPSNSLLRREATDLGLEPIVTFEGAVDSRRVIDILQESDILIAPSITGPHGEQEGLPNSLKEAMAVGVLAIGTRAGGTPELIRNAVNGYLVEEKDPNELASCIEFAITHWDSVKPIIEEARRTIVSEFDMKPLHTALEDEYRGLVEES